MYALTILTVLGDDYPTFNNRWIHPCCLAGCRFAVLYTLPLSGLHGVICGGYVSFLRIILVTGPTLGTVHYGVSLPTSLIRGISGIYGRLKYTHSICVTVTLHTGLDSSTVLRGVPRVMAVVRRVVAVTGTVSSGGVTSTVNSSKNTKT